MRHKRVTSVAGMALIVWLSVVTSALAAASKPGPGPEIAESEARLLAAMRRDGTNAATLYALGDVCHAAGVAGDKPAVARAEAYLRQLLAMEPTNAPAVALLGSVYTLKGRDAFWPTTQLKLVREGNEFMDRAVALAPEAVNVRVTRAFNNAHMPDFLGRSEIVVADLQWLWGKVETEPALLTVQERQEVALHWGRRLKRQSRPAEARRVWEAGLALAPDSRIGQLISPELAKLR